MKNRFVVFACSLLSLAFAVPTFGALSKEYSEFAKGPLQHLLTKEERKQWSAIATDDHEEAAVFFNRCREKGVQGSNTDFLICAVAVRNGFAIFTTDDDFTRFARILPIALHAHSG